MKTIGVRAFDIETYEENSKLIPYCISYVSNKETMFFYGGDVVNKFIKSIYEEQDTLRKKNKKSYMLLYCHNLTFDGSIIIQNLNKSHNASGMFIDGNIYSLKISNNRNVIYLKCSYRLFPTKLENAHNLLNTNKKIELNHAKITKINWLENIKDIKEYCINDSIIVHQLVSFFNKFFSSYIKNWCVISCTLPSISYNIFKIKFNRYKVDLSLDVDNDRALRIGYFGGRCEVFGNAVEDEMIYHFDFSGMYAQVMRDAYGYGKMIFHESINDTNKAGFYFIEFYSNMDIPILPEKCLTTGKLLFKNGFGSGLYWHEEINLFKEFGGIILEIKYAIIPQYVDHIFKDFVDHFTDLRKKDIKNNTICKLIINSLYGRLGMGEIHDKTEAMNLSEYRNFYKKNMESIIKESIINDINIVKYSIKPKSDVSSNVSLAMAITSKARIKLYRGFIAVINGGGRVLYSDTDSIFAAFRKNVDNTRMGEVYWDTSKNDTKIDKAFFAMPKAYALVINGKDLVKIKGVPRNSISYDDFISIFHNASISKLSISIISKSNYLICVKNALKIINLNNYDKRIFINNYTETAPLENIFTDPCWVGYLFKTNIKNNPYIDSKYKILMKEFPDLPTSRIILNVHVDHDNDGVRISSHYTNIVHYCEIVYVLINYGGIENDKFENSKEKILEKTMESNAMFYECYFKKKLKNFGLLISNNLIFHIDSKTTMIESLKIEVSHIIQT